MNPPSVPYLLCHLTCPPVFLTLSLTLSSSISPHFLPSLSPSVSSPEVLCSGSSSMDSTEHLPSPIGLRDLVDYGSYMSRLIGLEGSSPSPSPSPCHSDQGSPTARKRVRYKTGLLTWWFNGVSIPRRLFFPIQIWSNVPHYIQYLGS